MKRKIALITCIATMITNFSALAFNITDTKILGDEITLPSTVQYEGSSYSVTWDKTKVSAGSEGVIHVKGQSAVGECNLYILVTKADSVVTSPAHLISYSEKTGTFTAEISGDNEYAALSVYKKTEQGGTDFDNYQHSASEASEAKKIENGFVEFIADISGFDDGTYVYFISSGESTAHGEFIYRDADNYVSSVKSASGDTMGTALVNLYNDYDIILSPTLESVYNGLSQDEKETVMKNMHRNISAMENAVFEDIVAEIDREIATVMYLKSNDKKAFLESTAPSYSVALETDTAADGYYNGIANKEAVISYINTAAPGTSSEIFKAFYEAVAITAMNEAERADVLTVMNDLNKVDGVSILGMDSLLAKLNSETELTDAQKNSILAAMAAVDNYTSVAQITQKLSDQITANPNPGTTDNDLPLGLGTVLGGNNGGGGGNSASGSAGSTYVEPTVEQNEELVEFTDLAEAEWAKPYVKVLAENGVVSGYGSLFRPNDPVTRGEFSKILSGVMNLPESEYAISFKDVNPDDWYAAYINKLYNAGIIKGESENEFNPNGYLTREDMCVLVCRAKQYADGTGYSGFASFADSGEISEYAMPAVAHLQAQQVVSGVGDNMFMPQSVCSRAAICKVVVKYFDIK